MQTQLPQSAAESADATTAAGLIRRCVHCGFCNATCPTYQLLGDERDGPRGRIYLIKQMLEGQAPTERTQLHLDRCLTCRACETTCPSGVEYGRLVEIGRSVLTQRKPRRWHERMTRHALVLFLTGPLFAPALRVGQWMRPLLPSALKARIPQRDRRASPWPQQQHARRVLLLEGCVQPALSPNINAATARVLNAVGIEVTLASAAGCCGAIAQHLDERQRALEQARRNIDAWWPLLESGVEAVVFNATGCGTQLREYGWLLRDDPAYAARAARVSQLSRDVSSLLAPHVAQLRDCLAVGSVQRIAYHAPCSQQHGLKARGAVESLLGELGVRLTSVPDAHLCCGSAGTYSLLHPEIASQLREAKLLALQSQQPQQILSANIGCIQHLNAASAVPVRHWIEWLDAQVVPRG
jgi:glycolate oxidase iron-sulfur subunit